MAACNRCVHFVAKTKKCKKWGTKASDCREDDMMCGARAWDFEEATAPLCLECIYFNNDLCKIFSSQHPVSGEVMYVDAYVARLDQNLCGEEGFYYEYDDEDDYFLD
jgi:hypothetical protein